MKVDLENPNNQQLAAQFQIRSIPAVWMIFQGKMPDEFNGALPEAQIKQWLDEHLPISQETHEEDDDSLLLATIESGERNKSREILLSQYSDDPENDELKIALAMQLLPDRLEGAKKLTASVQVPERFSVETEVVQTIKQLNDFIENND